MDAQCAFYNPLLYWGNVLESFIESSSFPVSIKEARTGKYTLSNAADAGFSGLSPDEVIGLDLHDIAKINGFRKKTIQFYTEFDHQVKVSKSSMNCKGILPQLISNSIRIEETLKKPVFGQNQKVIAIMSVSSELTPYTEPNYLFSIYKQYFPIKRAIHYFLKYLQIDSCFKKLPTNQELITLLTLRKSSVAKYAARVLDISHKTVEAYKANIQKKLNVISLDELLIMLRVRHEQKSPCA